MKFYWRYSEQDPAEKITSYLGLQEDVDKTPVAMFALANGVEVGLSMDEIGDLVENHNEILHNGSAMPAAERNAFARERQLAYDGANEISFKFNLLLDDRLRPYEPAKERQPGVAQASEYAKLMQRLALKSLRKD